MTDDEIDAKWRELSGRRPDEPVFSLFENWPGYLFYIPLVFAWMYYGFRYRGLTVPLLSNPDIEFGGLCGESKCSVLGQLGAVGRAATAPYICFAVRETGTDASDLLSLTAAAGLSFPMVVKPDISRRGTGVQIMKNAAAIAPYLAAFPEGARLIAQQLVRGEGEAGVMYLRHPDEPRGRIVSLTLKYFPQVVGDGKRTLRSLILADPRASRLARSYFAYNSKHLDEVVPKGESFKLTHVGNHVRGALFRDGRQFVTAQMEDAFEQISRELPRFHLGRFDVRFERLSDLCAGRNFTIIEINGVGSEVTHIWDRSAKLIPSYSTLISHVRSAFKIGSYYQGVGVKAPSAACILRAYFYERKLMASYPKSEVP